MHWNCERPCVAIVSIALTMLCTYAGQSLAQEVLPEWAEAELTGPNLVARSMVSGIQITGNKQTPENKIRSMIQTRIGRKFDPESLQSDVRRLAASGLFRDVKILTDRSESGIYITFQVFERPRIAYIKFLGNESVRDKTLLKKSEMNPQGSLNKYVIEEARVKLEDFYHTRGHGKATVRVVEGLNPEDQGVVFMIHEGPLARIWDTSFVGNSIASDGRLKTQIKSKPGFAWVIGGTLDQSQVESDIDSLIAYYRSLGFFRAQVNRLIEFSEDGKWASIQFVVDEGPRYEIRNISFVGHTRFTDEQLDTQVELEPGQFFDQKKQNSDLSALTDLYGSQGYIHADIKSELRFLEEPGQLDLVYDIREGDQYRVGNIKVVIKGDSPHTKQSVILNRLTLQPGQIIDTRMIRQDERRIKSAGVFVNEPHRGVTPTIKISPPELGDLEPQLSDRGSRGTYRGQSPNPSQPVGSHY